jgi:hypothetical protein
MLSWSESARCTGLHRRHQRLAALVATQVTLPAGRREVNDQTSAVVSRPSGKSQAGARRLNRLSETPPARTHERSRNGNSRRVGATPSKGTP